MSWGICITRVFNCLTIYDELNCIGLQVYAIYMPYKSYSANLESRDGSWIIIMTLGKDNSVLTYFCTFAIYKLHKNINIICGDIFFFI